VIYRVGAAGEWEIALIATRGGTRWQLPKGTCEPGETVEQTALREVKEECGLAGQCEAHLGAIEYWYWDTHHRTTPELVQKRVDFYLMQAVGGELSDASIEVDSVNWFTLSQASQVLTYPSEREMVSRATGLLAASGC
jgi:8-oxo-dGTP pyrophosphatase MutT (NUDIX family)